MKTFRMSAVLLAIVLALAACSSVEDAALLEAEASAAKAPATYLIVNQGTLPANLPVTARVNRDTLRSFHPEAGFASVLTANPDAYKRYGTVMRDITVQWIEPTKQVALDVDFANPPFSGDNDPFFDMQWGHDAVNAVEAWNEGVRGAGVRVAVLDTGFDLDHPDLAPNINLALSADMTGEGLQYAITDTFSHGTHVAGTIAAADNGFGTIGVAPEAELVLVKVLSDEGSGSFEDVMEGIIHAADVDADIMNMSLGALLLKSGFCDEEGCVTAREVQDLRTAMERVIRYAIQKGTLVVASAGNDALDFDHVGPLITLPGSAAGVVTVSATAPVGWAKDPLNEFLDYPASYTNYGRSHVDFAAPGGDVAYPGEENCVVAGLVRPCWVFDLVFSTGNGGWYWSAGTSMAAPHVAGVAALILSEYVDSGGLTPSQLEAELRKRADDLGQPGKDPFYGLGRVASGY